ncbi:putative ABC transport system permease protein [Chryseolinea serpens]|uniref:Putative ABC transport system permease protein n=1 Tax=Chryseolinea serpens TaxID=947013 RepID=A0A1M5XCM4_9BACT|nr:ABC transporter permease [Chryseolinea serpens]SHH97412.1 putative ABC transport system permease protein [Chryseolinea serpens]
MKAQEPHPPRFLLKFFRWFCHPELQKYIEGDLLELYSERLTKGSKRKADWGMAGDVLLLLRPSMIRPVQSVDYINPHDMFRNYFKVGIRNILKYKVFSFINVFGLAVAMSLCMLIILMLADQHRYDAFHEKKARIYRILTDYEGSRQAYATSPYPLAAALKTEYTVAEDAVTLMPGVGGDASYQQRVATMRGYFADPSFFHVFSFDLVQGDKKTALTAPYSVIISKTLANQLFEHENPLGKVIDFSDRQLPFPLEYDGLGAPPVNWGSFTVTGVMDEGAYKSHLAFDALVSTSTRQALINEKKAEDLSNNWEWFYRAYTYALVRPDKNEYDLNTALADLVAHKYANLKFDQVKGFNLTGQALTDIQTNLQGNDVNNRLPRIGYYFLSILAAIVMVLACLNYTNLSTARALTRAKEIGVRKVTGANRTALVFQFVSESIITSLLALGMAVMLLLFIAPAFKGLWVNQYLNFELPSSFEVYGIFIGFAMVIGIVAGLYPAFHLSLYQPIKALKNLGRSGTGKLGLRKALSVSQFVTSLFFITTAILIYQQFKHYLEFDYGFTSKNIVNVQLQGHDYRKIANAMSTVPGVSTISATDLIPAGNTNNNCDLRKVNTTGDYFTMGKLTTDENFITNLDLKIIAGKNLPVVSDSSSRFIVVNDAAVKKLGYAHPADILGEVFEAKGGGELLEVVGVVKDFRYKLLINQDEIEPLVIQNIPSSFAFLNIKIESPNLMATVGKMEQTWKRVDAVHPFRYQFYDQQLASMHQGVFDLVSILGFIAFLAITIACLGLLGMATYASERRTKEVGIRKVLGAEDASIALLLSKEFMWMIGLSIAIGAPLSYFVNNLWLQSLPNRVEFGMGILTLGVAILLALGLVTIGSQTWRASRAKPVDALKVE